MPGRVNTAPEYAWFATVRLRSILAVWLDAHRMPRGPRSLDTLRKEQQVRLDALMEQLTSLVVVTRAKVRPRSISGKAVDDAPTPGTLAKRPVDRVQLQAIIRRAEELKEGAVLPTRAPAGLNEFVTMMVKQHEQLHRIVGDERRPSCNPLGRTDSCNSPFAGVAEHFDSCRRLGMAGGVQEIFSQAKIGRLKGPLLENGAGQARRVEGIGSLAAALTDLASITLADVGFLRAVVERGFKLPIDVARDDIIDRMTHAVNEAHSAYQRPARSRKKKRTRKSGSR